MATEETCSVKIGDPAYVLEAGFLWLGTITNVYHDGEMVDFASNHSQLVAQKYLSKNLISTKKQAKTAITKQILRLKYELEKLELSHYEQLQD